MNPTANRQQPTHTVLSYPSTYRAEQVDAIVRALRRRYSVQICGLGGSGKSHLLRFIAWNTSLPGRLPTMQLLRAYLDCNALGIDDAAACFRALALEFGQSQEGQLSAYDALARLRQFLASQMQPDTQIVAVIDRIDRLPLAQLPALLDGLRHLRDYLDRRVCYVLGSRSPLPIATLSIEFDDLMAHPPVIWVGPLSLDDALWTLHTILQEIQHAADEATQAALLELSGRHARLLRALTLAWADMQTLDINQLLTHGQIERICRGLWEELDQNNQRLLLNLAQGRPVEARAAQDLIRMGLARTIPEGVELSIPILEATLVDKAAPLELSALEQQLWDVLRTAPDTLIARSRLIEQLYGDDPDGINDEALTALVGRLRRKLNDARLGTIVVVRGQGYRYQLAVDRAERP